MIIDSNLNDHITGIAYGFEGQSPDLINAMGALCFGRLYGWRALRICISKNAYYKHQKTLGIEFVDVLPEITALTDRSVGYLEASNTGHYWDTIRGEHTIDSKQKARIAIPLHA